MSEPTSWSQHCSHAYSITLVTAGRARYQVDWGLGIGVVMSRHGIVEDWPEALVRVLMRFNDQIHTVLEKQRLEARDIKTEKLVTAITNELLSLAKCICSEA